MSCLILKLRSSYPSKYVVTMIGNHHFFHFRSQVPLDHVACMPRLATSESTPTIVTSVHPYKTRHSWQSQHEALRRPTRRCFVCMLSCAHEQHCWRIPEISIVVSRATWSQMSLTYHSIFNPGIGRLPGKWFGKTVSTTFLMLRVLFAAFMAFIY